MGAAGDYNARFLWLKCTTEDDDTGDGLDTHVPNGYLWVSCEDQSGLRNEDAGGPQTGAQVEIRVRNNPTLTTNDLLHDEFNGLIYHLDTITFGDDELIVDGYRNDKLINFTLEDDDS